MKRILKAVTLVVLFVAIGLAVRSCGFTLIRISGTSMNDTLKSGDIVLVTRLDYLGHHSPKRMDVVECAFPDRADTYVKRVIGLPGEHIAYSDSMLSVNGQPVSEPYVIGATGDFYINLAEDSYFVMGDNRAQSYDSRAADMGPIRKDAFLGRVRWIVWPISRFGPVE